MSEHVKKIERRGHTIRIFQDQDLYVHNPRQWDNVGRMICFHSNYRIGDQDHDFTPESLAEYVERDDVIALPIYLYDHSVQTIATSIQTSWYHWRWDAGLIGYIYVTEERLAQEHIDPERAEDCLRAEIETYDQYLRGDIYGWVIDEDDLNDSCWGYFGSAGIEQAISEAQSLIDHHVERVHHQSPLSLEA